MHYIEMTIEEANEYYRGTKGKTVLVAVQDLEKDDVVEFTKRNKDDCVNIICEAETIARVYDDFINQLRVFTEKQSDIRNIMPRGKLSTILLKE
ncbi:hypothetical protein [Lacrimispora sp.]|uniref:hypothetical protein n=1 Tax=Lacrimispora sp. TaxID=2719234 RepID=UPI0028AB9E4F|nr:hypothetical protein [Lacrimispora sp.]